METAMERFARPQVRFQLLVLGAADAVFNLSFLPIMLSGLVSPVVWIPAEIVAFVILALGAPALRRPLCVTATIGGALCGFSFVIYNAALRSGSGLEWTAFLSLAAGLLLIGIGAWFSRESW